MKDFLESNKLNINTSKTTLIEMMLQQKRAKAKGTTPTLDTTDEIGRQKTVETSREATLLGGPLQNSMSW